jgi:soluble lytic murein transglycosylase-like protein
MKKNKYLTCACIICSIFCCVLSFCLYEFNNYLIDINKQLNHRIDNFNNYVSNVEQQHELYVGVFHALEKRFLVLEESVPLAEKKYAKAKKIREVVVSVISRKRYFRKMNITELTLYSSAVAEFSEMYNVPVPLILAVTEQESAFDPLAVSHAGAEGLMQIMPPTARECANDVKRSSYNIFRIKDNVQFGTWYLRKMLDEFKDDICLAVRAYNAGPTYVKKYKDVKYPKETVEYHKKVLEYMEFYKEQGL